MEFNRYDIKVDEMDIHFIDSGERTKRPLLLLHSLSDNTQIFNGLIASGLAKDFRLIIPDLPGRGRSSKTKEGLSLEQHCEVLNKILDHAELTGATLCGHSFGGLLAIYFAAHFPGRSTNLILLDADIQLNPLTPFLLVYPFARLFMAHLSLDEYMLKVKAAPFIDEWDDAMIPFLMEDVEQVAGAQLQPKAHWMDIYIAASNISAISYAEWKNYLAAVRCPALLIQAIRPFAHGQHIVMDSSVYHSMCILKRAEHVKVQGNHFTMLFGEGAKQITAEIEHFLLAKQVAVADTAVDL